jgi:hypothetical protein
LDIAWAEDTLTSPTVRSVTSTVCKMRYGEKTVDLKLARGASKRLTAELVESEW